MVPGSRRYVTPAQAGVHERTMGLWIPAFAGMTKRWTTFASDGWHQNRAMLFRLRALSLFRISGFVLRVSLQEAC
jgi:hypothetical protein